VLKENQWKTPFNLANLYFVCYVKCVTIVFSSVFSSYYIKSTRVEIWWLSSCNGTNLIFIHICIWTIIEVANSFIFPRHFHTSLNIKCKCEPCASVLSSTSHYLLLRFHLVKIWTDGLLLQYKTASNLVVGSDDDDEWWKGCRQTFSIYKRHIYVANLKLCYHQPWKGILRLRSKSMGFLSLRSGLFIFGLV